LHQISPVQAQPTISPLEDNTNSYPNNTVPAYGKLELTFTITSTSASNYYFPFDASPPAGLTAGTGISVDGIFTSPNGEISIQPGFIFQEFIDEMKNGREWFYPTNTMKWKVRFSPPTPGNWSVVVRATDASGTSESTAYSFIVSDSQSKGFIKVSPRDPRYFEYDDGTYFPGMGFNMNFSDVSWYSPTVDNQHNFQVMGENGIQLIRIWLSQWAIGGSEWNPYMPTNPDLLNSYTPYTGITFDEAYPGSEVSMKVNTLKGSCMYANQWKNRWAVQPGKTYRIRVRYKAKDIVSNDVKVAGKPYGFSIKVSDNLLWHATDESKRCYMPDTGTYIITPQSTNTDWTILEGNFTTGNSYLFPRMYFVMENVNSGTAYVDYIWVEEDLGNGTYGPNIVSKPWMAHHQYFEQRNSLAFDKVLELAEKHGVYLRVTVMEKGDRILKNFDFNGVPDTSLQGEYFYGDFGRMTKTRWLQQAWWRYLQARWGYSTQIHSWELVNEGDPFSGRHFTLADEFGKYMHQFNSNSHLVTTSTWHSFPVGLFWGDTTKYENIDYATYHQYIPEGKDTTIRVDVKNADGSISILRPVISSISDYYDMAASTIKASLLLGAKQEFGAGKPTIRGEVGYNLSEGGANNYFQNDTQGIWLHNFIWGQINPGGVIESYWYWDKHIVWDKNGIDNRKHFGAYYDFIENIPLSNGNYSNADSRTSTPEIRVIGQKDIRNKRAHLWIQNINHTWKNVTGGSVIPPLSGTVTLDGFEASKDYQVEWWETYSGNVSRTETVTTNSSGTIILSIDNLISDVAVKIGDYTLTSPVKIGDLDGDGDVDIFDYNLLVQYFNQSNCAYNLIGACLIDIFDYNLMVQNFQM